jgi:hypothetical protein
MDDGANDPVNNGFPKPEGKTSAGKGTGWCRVRQRWRLVGLALALFLAAVAVAVWVMWDRGPSGPSQILTLGNGEKYQFVGTTYGTRNVPPSFEAKLVSALPARLANLARKYVGPQISQYNAGEKFDPPHLFIWFRRNVPASTPGPPLTARLAVQEGIEGFFVLGNSGSIDPTARLADQGGVEAGLVDYSPAFESSLVWHYASFAVIPRRSRVLELNFYPYNGGVGSVRIPNPLYGIFPEWKPEPVPAVKKAGDLEVRLDDFVTGSQIGGAMVSKPNGSRSLPFRPAAKGRDHLTGFDFSLRSSRGTNEVWVLQSAELSDATGNVLRNTSFRSSMNAFHGYARPQLTEWSAYSETIAGTLWPDEAAWRLKLELKRASGFAPEEIVTFKNVPVPAMGTTNHPGLTKSAGGIQVALTKFVRRPNLTGNGMDASQVTIELPGKLKGVDLDFLDLQTDAGQAEIYSTSPMDFACVVYLKSIPANAKTMDFTFVVQKTRSVEFLVKPPKGE